MRVLPIAYVEPGSVLARNIYLGKVVLLAAGAWLTPRLLELLMGHGIRTLYLSRKR